MTYLPNCAKLRDMTIACAFCGEPVTHYNKRKKYCSQPCYLKGRISGLGRKKTKAEINAAYRARNLDVVRHKGRTYYHHNARKHKDRMLRQRYGVGIEWYEQKAREQNNLCAVCMKPEIAIQNTTGEVRPLAVDHDHTSGKARALLCYRCNAVLGAIEHQPELTKLLILYLEKHGKHLFD